MGEKFARRAPEVVGIFTAVARALAACSGDVNANQSPAATTTAQEPLKGSVNIHGCKGQVYDLQDVTWSKDGEIFKIHSINNDECVDLTNPTTHKSIGSVSLGDEIIGPCLFDRTTDNRRIHLLTTDTQYDYVGDVDVTPALAQSSELPTCDSKTPDIGFVHPR